MGSGGQRRRGTGRTLGRAGAAASERARLVRESKRARELGAGCGDGALARERAGALGRELMLGCAREGGRAVGEGVGWAGFWLLAGYSVLVLVFLFFFKPHTNYFEFK